MALPPQPHAATKAAWLWRFQWLCRASFDCMLRLLFFPSHREIFFWVTEALWAKNVKILPKEQTCTAAERRVMTTEPDWGVTKCEEVWEGWGAPSHPRLGGNYELRLALGLEAGLQAVKRACWAGGSSWFTGIDGEIDATVNGVVILVGGWGLAGVLPPPPGGIVVRVVNERDAGGGVVYPKLGVSHEVVDGWSWVWLFQAFIEGATERIHHADLPWEKGERARWGAMSRERIEGSDGEGENLAVVVRRVGGGAEGGEGGSNNRKGNCSLCYVFHIRCLHLTRF